ncbi:MAG: chromosome segregation DNA-binding protein [Cyanobacteria bacterium RYN_339]|nr:chromosome segregation DNA-binding protein [Cyanobacteria bacterium RYN_339]
MSTSLKAFDQLATAKRQQRGTPVPQIPLVQIAPLQGQPRKHMDQDALAELAESIKAHGVIQPILLIPRKAALETDVARYSIVCGERRFQACRLAGLDSIPALIRDYEDSEVALLALLENLQREDLTPLEEAEYLVQLKKQYGFTEEQLGDHLGKSRDYVHMRLRLLNLAPDIVETWRDAEAPDVFEKLTPSHAILVNQVADPEARQSLTQAVVADGITVAETRKRIQALKGDMPAKAPRPAPVKGARLALEDLAMFDLLAPLVRAGATDVSLAELAEALERDMAWLKRLQKNGLAS